MLPRRGKLMILYHHFRDEKKRKIDVGSPKEGLERGA
jgi:hypothetical protein